MYEKQGFYSGQPLAASQLDAMEDGIIEAQEIATTAQEDINTKIDEVKQLAVTARETADQASASAIEANTAANEAKEKANSAWYHAEDTFIEFKNFPLQGSIYDNGSIQQQTYNGIPGAIANGEGAIALGGQRYDKAAAGESTNNEPQTQANGEQSFAAGGGVVVNGAWSTGFGKDTKTFLKGCFAANGGTQAGITYEDWLVEYHKGADSEANQAEFAEAYAKDYCFATAFNDGTKALARASTTLGTMTVAKGNSSLATGLNSVTEEMGTFAGGWNSIAKSKYGLTYGTQLLSNPSITGQAVLGQYNFPTKSQFIVGGGDAITRMNLFEVRQNGDICMYHEGKMYSLYKIFNELGMFKTSNEIDMSAEIIE